MPVPLGSYVNGAKFAFPRSYVQTIRIRSGTAQAFWSDNVMSLQPVGGGLPYWTLVFDPDFWGWSSNKRTLDYVLSDAYYQVWPDPTHNNLPIQLWWVHDGNINAMVLDCAAFGSGSFFNYKSTPPAPPGYWLPPPFETFP